MLLDVNLYATLSDLIKDNIPIDWSDTKLNYACFGAQSAMVILYAVMMGHKCWQKRLVRDVAKNEDAKP